MTDMIHLKHTVLLRIVSGGERGATRAEIRRDIAPLVVHCLTDPEWAETLDDIVTSVAREGLLERVVRGRLVPSMRCVQVVEQFCGGRLPKRLDWPIARNSILVAIALGMKVNQATRLKTLASADGLRMAVLEKAYGLKFKAAGPSTSELRNELARVAYERGFAPLLMADGRLSSEVVRSRMSPEDARWIAAGLAGADEPCNTDVELIARIAAQQVGISVPDSTALRYVVIQRFLGAPRVREDGPPESLEAFAAEINRLASEIATGWAGNRKAFISHVWARVLSDRASWGIAEAEFKSMLTDAHRAGFLTLSNADLRDATSQRDIAASATTYMNTDWHYIRALDERPECDAEKNNKNELTAAAG